MSPANSADITISIPSHPVPHSASSDASSPPLPRRCVLGAAVAAVTPPAVAQASEPTRQPDAELIGVCSEFDDLERLRLSISVGGADYIADEAKRNAAYRPIQTRQDLLLERITDLRASTLDGLRARAKAVLLWDDGQEFFVDASCGFASKRIVNAILRDLVRDGAPGQQL